MISGDTALARAPCVSEKLLIGKIVSRPPVAGLVIVPLPTFRGAVSPNGSPRTAPPQYCGSNVAGISISYFRAAFGNTGQRQVARTAVCINRVLTPAGFRNSRKSPCRKMRPAFLFTPSANI
jgi:hypothetical protein